MTHQALPLSPRSSTGLAQTLTLLHPLMLRLTHKPQPHVQGSNKVSVEEFVEAYRSRADLDLYRSDFERTINVIRGNILDLMGKQQTFDRVRMLFEKHSLDYAKAGALDLFTFTRCIKDFNHGVAPPPPFALHPSTVHLLLAFSPCLQCVHVSGQKRKVSTPQFFFH